MKKDAYQNSRLKYELLNKKRNGVKEIIWKLHPDQVIFIQTKFGFEVEPYLYEIKTRPFCSIRTLDNFLKDIHYRNKKGKEFIVLKLTKHQKDVLDEFNVKYRPYKYKIRLND